MKLEEKYAVIIIAIIILVFLFAFFYFSEFTFRPSIIVTSIVPSNVENNTENPVPTAAKTFSFVSASCSVSGGVDTVRFKIQAGEANIGVGEMAVFLDNSGATFKDPQGNELKNVALNANLISDEFSYTAQDHKDSRTVMVSSPAGTVEQIISCS